MRRNVCLAALALAVCLSAAAAVPVVTVDVQSEGNDTPELTTLSAWGEEGTTPRQRPDEGTEVDSAENVIPGNGNTGINVYCRCYEIPGGLELCVTVMYEEVNGELVARRRRFVRSVVTK